MQLELENLTPGGEFTHDYAPDELQLDERDLKLTQPVTIWGRVFRKGEEVQANATLTTAVETPCGRCLKPVVVPIRADFTERFVTAVSWHGEEQHELAAEDLNLSIFDGEAIDLDGLVREEILLATPGQVYCREDCQGLCAVCGVDRNVTACDCETQQVDSRWEKLRDLVG